LRRWFGPTLWQRMDVVEERLNLMEAMERIGTHIDGR
jgi:hypothetical protein